MKGQQQPTAAPAATRSAAPTGRKPWKKRTPIQVVLDQIDRLAEDVAAKEEEFKAAKRQLEKLEGVRKSLESS